MAMPLNINSLIAQFFPGVAPSSPRQEPTAPSSPPQDFGTAVVRQPSSPASAEGQSRLVYTRQEAQGKQPEPPGEGNPGRDGVTNDALVGQAADEARQGSESGLPADSVKKPNGEFLSKAETAVLRELQKADLAVRAHEMAHLAAAGGYARGGATFSYQRGPDGQNYAVGGEVQIDTGKEATPEATIVKMQIVRQAALAPADPSPQDQRVAAHATLQIAEASKELLISRVAQSQAPAPQQPEGEGETPRDIYRQAAPEIAHNSGNDAGARSPQQRFSAYLAAPPSQVENDRSPIDRIA